MISPESESETQWGLAALIGLNLIPVYGVFAWGWQSFDLIYLYWLENVVIGIVCVARMVIRPYGHAIELAFPLFLAPFFTLHYGAFTWGHGTFVVSLFGAESSASSDIWSVTVQMLSSAQMCFAIGCLAVAHVLDWGRDIHSRGLGADDLKTLMTRPYRRIVVLHLTIIAGGFALGAMNEPLVGLIILIIFKTTSDLWHWRKDRETLSEEFVFTPDLLKKMQEKYPEPKVAVNGVDRRFDSFAELKASKEFRMAQGLMRMIGASEDLKAVQAYMDMRIREERQTPLAG